MLTIRKLRYSLLLLLTSGVTSYAQPVNLNRDIQAIIDLYLIDTSNQEKFSGIYVSISYPNNDDIIKKNFFAGKTEHNPQSSSITRNTLYDIGSITKSYTSAIILQLEEEGLLDINDSIGKWFPQYPMWKNVTIKQLLNMTSGIPNYSSTQEFDTFIENNPTANITNELLLSFAHPNQAVTPGKKYEYSNTNYILAGMIIEQVTKQKFNSVLQTRILDKLNMKNTYYPSGDDWKKINAIIYPHKAHGYFYDYKEHKLLDLTNVNLSWAGTAGAIVSTPSDQVKWVNALYHGDIFSENYRQKSLGELMSVVSMKTGQPIKTVDKNNPSGFGLGVGLAYDNDARFWFYEGSTLSYRMMYIWKQCNNVTVIAALNSKGGEGDPKSPVTDNIKYLVLDIYKKILKAHPNLECRD
jgi:D-alanyl-D-alanine carboxypeptidase